MTTNIKLVAGVLLIVASFLVCGVLTDDLRERERAAGSLPTATATP